MKATAFLLLLLLASLAGSSKPLYDSSVMPAAGLPAAYVPLLKNKRVAVVVNQTSEYRGASLVDILSGQGIALKRIFVPEHGFRGKEDAGAHIENETDAATGLPVVSLYGSNKKPKAEYLADIDVLVYDLQDVGARFYTYISTLEYCMEACAENGKQLVVLDRPNPNGFYVDGPVMETEHKSFVGMQRIPIVYGMTPGEYAMMLAGEKWLKNAGDLKLEVVKCANYTHKSLYKLPVAPSPNLRTMEAVYAYPSLCLFEGTAISMGRGTDKPFRQYGCPEFEGKLPYVFTPKSGAGAKKPPYEDRKCYGELVAATDAEILKAVNGQLQLGWLIKALELYPTKSNFFTSFFTKLAGNTELETQLKKKMPEKDIKKSWAKDIKAFKKTRRKYLLYPDFE